MGGCNSMSTSKWQATSLLLDSLILACVRSFNSKEIFSDYALLLSYLRLATFPVLILDMTTLHLLVLSLQTGVARPL